MNLLLSCFLTTVSAWIFWCCQPFEYPESARDIALWERFNQQTGYDLSSPTEKYLPPTALEEVSGLDHLRKNVLACVQDESGIIFYFDLKTRRVIERLEFAKSGDYEGLAVANKDIYVIKSNGKLYRHSVNDGDTEEIETPLSHANDVEGLAYDKNRDRLLIACKESPSLKKGKQLKGRAVYSYPLNGEFQNEPAIHITGKLINEWNDQQKVPLELDKKLRGFKPSGLAVHPKTGDIWVVANEGKVLLVTGPKGELRQFIPISPRIFKQPEGLCFAPNGDLFISNEARSGSANILKFAYKRPK